MYSVQQCSWPFLHILTTTLKIIILTIKIVSSFIILALATHRCVLSNWRFVFFNFAGGHFLTFSCCLYFLLPNIDNIIGVFLALLILNFLAMGLFFIILIIFTFSVYHSDNWFSNLSLKLVSWLIRFLRLMYLCRCVDFPLLTFLNLLLETLSLCLLWFLTEIRHFFLLTEPILIHRFIA